MANSPKQQPKPSLAQAMYPRLNPQAKAQNEEARERERQAMLENAIEAGRKMQLRKR